MDSSSRSGTRAATVRPRSVTRSFSPASTRRRYTLTSEGGPHGPVWPWNSAIGSCCGKCDARNVGRCFAVLNSIGEGSEDNGLSLCFCLVRRRAIREGAWDILLQKALGKDL